MWKRLRTFARKNPRFDDRYLNLGTQRRADFVVFLKDNTHVTPRAAARMPWLCCLFITSSNPGHHNFQLAVWQNERGKPLLMKEAFLSLDLDRPNILPNSIYRLIIEESYFFILPFYQSSVCSSRSWRIRGWIPITNIIGPRTIPPPIPIRHATIPAKNEVRIESQ